MRLRRLVLTFLFTLVVVGSGVLPRSSPRVIAAGPPHIPVCTPMPTGPIPPNAGTKKTGHLAIEIFTLRIPDGQCHPNPDFQSRFPNAPNCRAGGDTLPPGDPLSLPGHSPNTDQDWIRFGVGVFDTGSSVVVIGNVVDTTIAGSLGDTTYLQVCKPPAPDEIDHNCDVSGYASQPPTLDTNLPKSLDVRLWGFAAVNNAPFPFNSPQVEVPSITVRPSDFIAPTLIGTPVAAQVVANINYGNILTRTFAFGSLESPDIKFYVPGDPLIPSVPYEFPLVPQGGFFSPPDTLSSVGPRFRLRNAVFKNGNAAVANLTTAGILYDTGNSTTAINEDVARALGIDPVNGVPVDCQTLGSVHGDIDVKGFMIDRFEMTSTDGMSRYVIHNPLVYVFPGTNPFTANDVAIVAGANYFEPHTVQFNGKAQTLSISTAFNVADADENGQVNCADLAIVRASFGKRAGQLGFDPRADVNRDGIVNINDLSFVSRQLPAGTRC
jgi:hypothetical protein